MKSLIILFFVSLSITAFSSFSEIADESESIMKAESDQAIISGPGGDPSYIKGYPSLSGNTINCYTLNNAICLVVLEPSSSSTGHYRVPTPGGNVDLYGRLILVSSSAELDVYEVR